MKSIYCIAMEKISIPPTELVSVPKCTPAPVGAIGFPLVPTHERVAPIILPLAVIAVGVEMPCH